ncbi:MAG: hypothetical protein O7F14_05700 [Alphaproteobacteria bacterium]|nr:hypothetical protein [Alphaproteobacteria bacterium]
MEAPEPRTDPRQILMGMAGDIFALGAATNALGVFVRGIEEADNEETNGLRFLACEIGALAEAVKTHYLRLEKATDPNPPLKAV